MRAICCLTDFFNKLPKGDFLALSILTVNTPLGGGWCSVTEVDVKQLNNIYVITVFVQKPSNLVFRN